MDPSYINSKASFHPSINTYATFCKEALQLSTVPRLSQELQNERKHRWLSLATWWYGWPRKPFQLQLVHQVEDLPLECPYATTIKNSAISVLGTRQSTSVWVEEALSQASRSIMEHMLRVNPTFTLVQQNHWILTVERGDAAREKVEKPLQVRNIHEIRYLEWLANLMLVEKPNRRLGRV